MKVHELIKILSYYNEDSEVCFAFPSGDYWGTTLAEEVHDVDENDVVWSEYHRTYKIVEDEEKVDDKSQIKNAIVLS